MRQRILGIDPGSTATGYGVVERAAGRLVHVAHGILRPPKSAPLADRLRHLHEALSEVIIRHQPDVAVVEQVFVAASPRAALVLGQARGAALAALAAGGLSVREYSASQIKQSLTGNGRAAKRQVQTTVQRLLALDRMPATDASDALAAAIRHAEAGRLADLGVVPRSRRRRARPAAALRVRPAR